MSGKWFVYKDEIVQGPYNSDDVHVRLNSGDLRAADMIWGAGMTDWNRISWWQSELPSLLNYRPAPLPDVVRVKNRPPDAPTLLVAVKTAPVVGAEPSVVEAEPSTETVYFGRRDEAPDAALDPARTVQLAVVAATSTPEAWHYALSGQSLGPFDHAQLLERLKTAEPLHEVMLWTKGMKEWAPIYEFHELLSELNANKRAFPRAELDGKVVLEIDGALQSASLLTISEGGVSVRFPRPVRSGQNIAIEIQSRIFEGSIAARADVRFAVGGIVGLRFSAIAIEAKTMIGEYIRQSESTRHNTRAA